MGYLERWDVWLIIILVILVLIYAWTRYWGGTDPTRTCTSTDTDTMTGARVEEVITVDTEPKHATKVVNAIVVRQGTVVFDEKEQRKRDRQSKGEKRCLEVLESVYGKGALQVQVRLDELKNPKTQCNLELDIYHPGRREAWEYDGRQHHEVVPRFHPRGQADLDAQKERDALKNELCKKAGIRLTRIPYTVKLEDIERYILDRLPISTREMITYRR